MGGDPGFGGISGVGGAMVTPGVTQCAVPGRSLTASTTVPDYGEATAVFDGADIHFFWFEKSDVEVQDDDDVGAPGVYQCTLGTDGLFRGAAVPVSDGTGQVDALDGLDAVNVVSARVRGTPWVAPLPSFATFACLGLSRFVPSNEHRVSTGVVPKPASLLRNRCAAYLSRFHPRPP